MKKLEMMKRLQGVSFLKLAEMNQMSGCRPAIPQEATEPCRLLLLRQRHPQRHSRLLTRQGKQAPFWGGHLQICVLQCVEYFDANQKMQTVWNARMTRDG